MFMTKKLELSLEDNVFDFIKNEALLKNISTDDLIAKVLKENLNYKTQKLLKATEQVFGIWKDRKGSVENHIRKLRKSRTIKATEVI